MSPESASFLKELQEPTFLAFLDRLIAGGEIAFAIELLDFVYCDEEQPRQLPETLAFRVLSAFSRSESRSQGIDYHWSAVAERFIAQFPSRRTGPL